jgi:hypothetical protein
LWGEHHGIWYPRPTPPDIPYEERHFQSQFSASSSKLHEWNIDGLSEQEILNKLQHIFMVANNYLSNQEVNHEDIYIYISYFSVLILISSKFIREISSNFS